MLEALAVETLVNADEIEADHLSPSLRQKYNRLLTEFNDALEAAYNKLRLEISDDFDLQACIAPYVVDVALSFTDDMAAANEVEYDGNLHRNNR